MGGKFSRKTGLERNEAWWGLINLTFNLQRYLQSFNNGLVIA
jgi:IS5 family transposase